MEKTKPEKSSKLLDNKVMRTEFELHHFICRNHFKRRLQERCRNANITGYVIYKNHGRNACGVMEGLPEDINELKMWISCRYIPETFNKGLIFSAYEICRNPDRQEFSERTSVPDNEPLLADIHEKGIMALQEEAEQKAKAEAEEKTKPIKICWNPDSQEFSERTSVPDNEPLLADIHEEDIMALQEEAEQKAKDEAEEKTKPEKSSKLFDNKVMRTEFELHHIMRRNHFKQRLLERCRNANITGYVIYKDHGRHACGVMEGLPEDINELKIWISCRYIPEIFHKRLIFSAYEICWNPDRQEFCERTSVPDNEPLLADIYEKDILALQEKAAQKAKADKRAKQQAEAEEKTKPIKLRWYPDGQEFSEKTSVPDNEPLLADIYEEDMMALQEAEQKAMADKRAKQEAEAEAAAESEAESKSESEAAAESEASK